MKAFMNTIKKIEESKAGYAMYTVVYLILFFILFLWYMKADRSVVPEFIYSQF